MIGLKKFSVLLLPAIFTFSLPSIAWAIEPDAPSRLIDKEYMTLIAVRDELRSNARKKYRLTKSQLKGLTRFYGAPEARLLWIDEHGLDRKNREKLKQVFKRADEFGLNSRDYSLSQPEDASGEQDANILAKAELRTTLTAFSYAAHAQAGRFIPSSINRKYVDLKPKKPAVKDVLTALSSSNGKIDEALEGFHPTHPQFHALKAKLVETKSAIRAGSVPIRLPDGPSLGPETSHPHVAIIRERLSVAPPLDAPRGKAEDYYDEALAEAVRVFQESRGLNPDGIVGRNTREALNEGTIPVSVNTIISNMERWRWMPRKLGKRHIFVNVPEFKFRVISSDRTIYEERVVTGSPKHPTPIFTDHMETVVFNPYWNVPRSILVNEILPAARNNIDYIYRNNMEIIWQGNRTVDPQLVDWEYVDPNKMRLRQRPGNGNALGRVKFLFPNKHAVYMHDTPSKHLFNRPVRAYSHGCVRVRNPLRFAKLLLKDQGWSDRRINSTLDMDSEQHVRLRKRLPVHVSYFTAWVEEDGTLKGYRDIYGHDAGVRIALKLDSRKILASSEQDFEIGEQGLRN